MRERVRLVGGLFELDSAPDRGTAIRAWISLNQGGDHYV
jgi:signal transduction histidine kinase